MLSAVTLFLFALVRHGLAVLVNRTIDDQTGDPITGIMPTYSPEANWTQGATCTGCFAQPQRNMVFDGTWHDSTYFANEGVPRTITIPFNGSAIYIFFFTIPQLAGVADETHLNITLDAQPAGVFNFVPEPTDAYHYNVSVYSNSNILSGQHTIVISTGGAASGVLEFDYAVYTIEDGTHPSSSPSPSSLPQLSSSHHGVRIGAIVGGVVGGLLMIFALILLLFFRRRYGSHGRTLASDTLTANRNEVKAPMLQRGGYGSQSERGYEPQALTSDIDSHTLVAPVSENRDQVFTMQGYATPVSTSRLLEATRSNDPTATKANLRQAELRRRMQDIQLEMAYLERESMSQIPSSEPIHDADDLRANMELLRGEVELLRQAQHSQWAQGLSDEQVPAYTPHQGLDSN